MQNLPPLPKISLTPSLASALVITTKTLDAIITYAPSALYQNNVGVTIAADHPGREVMRTNTPLVYSGRQVRGDILNSMIPIERNGEILGYIWANELTEDIRRQAGKWM